MRLSELAEALDLRELNPGAGGDEEITRGFASDLLSDVLGHAPAGGLLVTVQVNPEVIAVAGLAGLRAIIFSGGRTPDREIVARATAEGLALFGSQADSFQIVGWLYQSGLRGRKESHDIRPPSLRGHGRTHRGEEFWPELWPGAE